MLSELALTPARRYRLVPPTVPSWRSAIAQSTPGAFETWALRAFPSQHQPVAALQTKRDAADSDAKYLRGAARDYTEAIVVQGPAEAVAGAGASHRGAAIQPAFVCARPAKPVGQIRPRPTLSARTNGQNGCSARQSSTIGLLKWQWPHPSPTIRKLRRRHDAVPSGSRRHDLVGWSDAKFLGHAAC